MTDSSPHLVLAGGPGGSSECGGEGVPCCACCGVAASTEGVSLRKCSACRWASYCSTDCQSRDWRFWHKPVCSTPAA